MGVGEYGIGGDGWVGGVGDNFIALRVKTNFNVCFMGLSLQ